MDIREYRGGDFKPCVEMFIRVFNGEPFRDQWTPDRAGRHLEEMVQRKGFLGLVAEAEGRLCGLLFGHKLLWWNGDQFTIQTMCVDQGTQRRGVGSAMLKHLKRELDRRGAMQINLLTSFRQWPASFYRKSGFVESEDLRFFYYYYRARAKAALSDH